MLPDYISPEEEFSLNTENPCFQNLGIGTRLRMFLNNIGLGGYKLYLDTVDGNDGNDGKSWDRAFKTLPAAYAVLRDGKNDTLYIANGSSVVLSEAFDWAKSKTHLVGVAGLLRFGGRVRIGHAGTAIAIMFTVSGSNNIFHNIHWQHGQASATNLICLYVTGLRNAFSCCHIEASLDTVASGGSYSWRALVIGSGAQANSFYKCTLGSWTTLWASANGLLVLFEGDNADTTFEDCEFLTNTSSTSMKVVGFTGPISGAYSKVEFLNCLFANFNAAPAVVFGQPTNGWVLIRHCDMVNASAWATTNTKIVIMNGAANIVAGGLAVSQT
jgi:hypothetical protein